MLFDAFICHASEDKDDFVRPLAERLKENRVEVWYDEFSLKVWTWTSTFSMALLSWLQWRMGSGPKIIQSGGGRFPEVGEGTGGEGKYWGLGERLLPEALGIL